MKWVKLIDSTEESLQRGALLKFKSTYPFEDKVIMMVCEGQSINTFGLMTITGFKAGINLYVQFPKECIENGLSKDWLVKNWNKWVWPEGNIDDVLIHEALKPCDL